MSADEEDPDGELFGYWELEVPGTESRKNLFESVN